MTTLTLPGTRVDFVDGDASAVMSGQVSIIVPKASDASFSYTITGRDKDGLAYIDINDSAVQVLFDGQDLENAPSVQSDETLIVQVTWSQGTSVVLIASFQTGDNTDTEYYFVLDGPALPAATTAAEWNAFDDSITGFTDPTGSFAPGAIIPFSSVEGTTIVEDDEFNGSPGRDRYNGGIGDDYFISSDGRDTYNGGKGYDQVAFTGDPGGATANLKTGTATDGWGKTDTLKSIEMLRGSAFDDSFTGNGGRNIMRGVEGNDTLNGAGGRDEVRYDRDDRYGGSDGVTVKLNKGFAIDGFGDRDRLKNFEDVRGSDYRDSITGNGARNELEGEGGNDTLQGLGGKDTLHGGAGRDKLNGGNGNDILNGDGGADLFIFKGSFGDDTITDFRTAGKQEKVDLSGVGNIKHFRDLKNNHLSENGDGDAVISDNNGNSITLEDIAIADLSANDFIF
ncbi:calcium-binding protein [Leisingera sp.]|uniref:calcium-binding protein n=1 Tax=Leisingera sp. TaxID=1879318 RepID=UPI002B27BDB5|nr:calcium-binding protein [Leisingera sp.]